MNKIDFQAAILIILLVLLAAIAPCFLFTAKIVDKIMDNNIEYEARITKLEGKKVKR